MIERQASADAVNRIINDPSIHPWVCGPDNRKLDLTQQILDGSYIALLGEHGGFLFWKLKDGIYDAHSAVLPDGRGSLHQRVRRLPYTDDADQLRAPAARQARTGLQARRHGPR